MTRTVILALFLGHPI